MTSSVNKFEKFCQNAEKKYFRDESLTILWGEFGESLSDLTQMSRKSVLFLTCPRSAIKDVEYPLVYVTLYGILNHICIVSTIEPIMVIIEYVPYGDLLGYLRKSRGLNDTYYKDPDVKPRHKSHISTTHQVCVAGG